MVVRSYLWFLILFVVSKVRLYLSAGLLLFTLLETYFTPLIWRQLGFFPGMGSTVFISIISPTVSVLSWKLLLNIRSIWFCPLLTSSMLLILYNASVEFLSAVFSDPFWVFTWLVVTLAYSSFSGVKFLISLFCSLFPWCGNSPLFWGAGQALEIVSWGWRNSLMLGCMTFSEFIYCESLWRPPCGSVSRLPLPGFQLSAGSPVLAPDLLYLGLKPCLPVLLAVGNESWSPTSSSTPLCISRSSVSFWHLESSLL